MESYLILIFVLFVLYKICDYLLRIPKLSTSSGCRNVVVTGCDSGFGNLFAKRMDRPGFQVFATCLTDIGRQNLDKQTSSRVKTLLMDVTNTKSIEEVIKFIKLHLKTDEGIHALVNNAGVATANAPAEWLSKEQYDKVLGVNLFGVIECSRLFTPLLRRSSASRIVNTASILGRIAIPYSAPYSISKYGVEAFSDCIRRELSRFNISVHMIEPGFFRTAITDPASVTDSLKKSWNHLSDDVRKQYGEKFVADAVVLTQKTLDTLCSDNVDQVLMCYEHAVTARFPRARYMVGNDARFVLWPLSLLPEWISDAVTMVMMPKPQTQLDAQ